MQVEFVDYTLHIGDDLFIAAGRERGNFERHETRIDLVIRTSRIFRKIDGKWLQIHHHGFIEDPALLQRYREAVYRDDISLTR